MSKTLFITGGSRGIGASTARLAARDGWNVGIVYAQDAKAAERVASDVAAAGRKAAIAKADVASASEIKGAFAELERQLGRPDGFFNNAGILSPKTRFADISEGQFDRIVGINLKGAFVAAQEAVRRMSKAQGGRGGAIVNMSSMLAKLGGPFESTDYAMTKAAIESMTIGMAKEFAGEGIRVNAVRPGLIDTEIHATAGDPGRVERMMGTVPLGRAGSAQDVAEAVLWLLSDKAAYTTGAILEIGGGRGI
ncbi:MAG: SDR family oxidoreductase [Proteobacteria bacterium]|nr:SDR family oxidoreductase [Pseudomonadota bacterium]